MKMLPTAAAFFALTSRAFAMDPAVINFASTTGRFVANASACHAEWEDTLTRSLQVVKLKFPDTSLDEFMAAVKIELDRPVECDPKSVAEWRHLQIQLALLLMDSKPK